MTNTPTKKNYRGRFAPSPSGPLHFGSLIAALGSFLDAKANHGTWLVRIEDIDTPRIVKGSTDLILNALDAYGLHWDENITYQSQRLDFYNDTLISLQNNEQLYPCLCTRKQIKAAGGIYNNKCRSLTFPQAPHSIRIKLTSPLNHFNDLIKGPIEVDPIFAAEDFIVKRRDGIFTYQLVVVLDDIAQNISHIIRGADLLSLTVRQLSLFQILKHHAPAFAHLPMAVAKPGLKLSKQNYSPAIDIKNPRSTLIDALRFLGLSPPTELIATSVSDILSWATINWRLNKVPKNDEIQIIKPQNGDLCQFKLLE